MYVCNKQPLKHLFTLFHDLSLHLQYTPLHLVCGAIVVQHVAVTCICMKFVLPSSTVLNKLHYTVCGKKLDP